MENSIILPEISEIKKFISEAYEDSKKKMNLNSHLHNLKQQSHQKQRHLF